MKIELLYRDPAELASLADVVTAIQEAARELESVPQRNLDKGVYLWGTNEVAMRIHAALCRAGVPILGVFDSDPHKLGSEFAGYVIEEPRNASAPIIACSYWNARHLACAPALGIEAEVLSVWELLLVMPALDVLPWAGLRLPGQFGAEDIEGIGKLLDRTADANELLMQVAARHFVSMLHEEQVPSDPPEAEYFVARLWPHSDAYRFLDLGAYSGDTIRRFADFVGASTLTTAKAIALEPDAANFVQLCAFSSSTPLPIIALKSIAGRTCGVVEFSENALGTASNVWGTPTTLVPSVTIDQLAALEPISHVKMDIEGFEREALAGAKELIERKSAYWALASYHRPDDLVSLASYFDDGYAVNVTSHAPRPWDTTLHFTPRSLASG